MTVPWKCSKGKATWAFDGELGIAEAVDLHNFAVCIAEDPKIKSVELDLTQVDTVSVASFQVLVALKNACAQASKGFEARGALCPRGSSHW